MKLNKIYLSAIFVLGITGFGLTSCADDLAVQTPDTEALEGIVLRIPNIEGAAEFAASRAGETPNSVNQEGIINDLYLFVFKEDGDLAQEVKDISGTEEKKTVGSSEYTEYTDYTLTLNPGTYKIYLLANCKQYIGEGIIKNVKKIGGVTGETGLKDLVLNFEGPLEADNLPMVCMSKIGTTPNPTAEDATITVS